MGLEGSGQETLWEEESRDPEGGWLSIHQPVVHEFASLDKIVEPGSKWLHGEIGHILPKSWNLTILKGEEHSIKVTGHEHDTVNGLLKIFQSLSHSHQESVELVHLLHQYSRQ